eukprot:s73_g7.t1
MHKTRPSSTFSGFRCNPKHATELLLCAKDAQQLLSTLQAGHLQVNAFHVAILAKRNFGRATAWPSTLQLAEVWRKRSVETTAVLQNALMSNLVAWLQALCYFQRTLGSAPGDGIPAPDKVSVDLLLKSVGTRSWNQAGALIGAITAKSLRCSNYGQTLEMRCHERHTFR